MSWKYNSDEMDILKADRKVLPATVSNATATAADVTGFSFALAAGETVQFEFDLTVTGGTNGAIFKLSGPSSVTAFRQTYFGNSTGVTAVTAGTTTSWSSGLGTATGAVINNATPFTGYVRITGSIINSSTAGTVQLQFSTASGTDNMSVLVGSLMNIRRNR
jgi:hypothetical protein